MENIKDLYSSKWFKIIKAICFLILFFIANKSGINNLIYSFIFGLYFALIWCNQNIILVSLSFVLAGIVGTFSVYNLIGNLFLCFIFLIFYGIHYKIKKPLKYLHILIYACLCNIPKVAIDICFNSANIYLVFIELLFGLLYTFACMRFFEGLCVRGVSGRLTLSEIVCGGVIVCAISCGLCSLNIYSFEFVKFFGILLLLFSSYVANFSITIMLSVAMGIGALAYSGNLTLFAILVLYGVVVSIFKTKNKYITVVAIIALECLFAFYFNFTSSENIGSFLPTIIAAFIYIVFPIKILDAVGSNFETGLYGVTEQSIINRNRELLYYKLSQLSDVFAEMNRVFRGMISGGLVGSDAKRLLLSEVRIKNCKNCPSAGKCYRVGNGEILKALTQMVDAGFERGRINLLDVPTLFAGKCEKVGALVTSINDLISQYKNYAGLVNNIDASKVLLAEQLLGVSNIMKDLAIEVNRNVRFEKGKEKKIIDELTYGNIICSDALVFEDDTDINVTVTVRKSDANKSSIPKIVGKAIGHNMEILDDVSSSRAGWQVLTLKSAPKYDVIFGIAAKTKTGSTASGDSYSVIKLKDGKYLFAICDGMGSGERAEQTSSTAMGLLENFFKAGFDREIIISSVNKLLSLGKDDTFSALDLCVVDTNLGLASFIKMGAPESYIKRKDTTDVVEIGALPLGIIQNIESKSMDAYLVSGDKIIICSDGISDSFKSGADMQDFVNNLPLLSPQKMADNILSEVLRNNRNIAKDDMTVIVIKIFER